MKIYQHNRDQESVGLGLLNGMCPTYFSNLLRRLAVTVVLVALLHCLKHAWQSQALLRVPVVLVYLHCNAMRCISLVFV